MFENVPNFLNFLNFEKCLLWALTIHVITQFRLFPLSLTVSEISTNLGFFEFKKKWNFRNVQKIQKFQTLCSISNCYWDKCNLLKIIVRFDLSLTFAEICANLCFLILIFFKFILATIRSFLTHFCQKLFSASFKYTGCSYKILNQFMQLFGLHRDHKIFFKLLNLKP